MLKDRTIVLGVTGGIAAYKACDLVSRLIKQGAQVRVVLTANAAKFVPPLTFETLSGNPVVTDTFEPRKSLEHISLAKWADAYVIAPASANVIGNSSANWTLPTGNWMSANAKSSNDPAATTGISGIRSRKYRNDASALGHSWISSKKRSAFPPRSLFPESSSSSSQIRPGSKSLSNTGCHRSENSKLTSRNESP